MGVEVEGSFYSGDDGRRSEVLGNILLFWAGFWTGKSYWAWW